jgi:GntR family transcriptional regulator
LTTKLLGKLALRRVPLDAENPFSGRRVFVLTRLSRLAEQPVLLERLYFDPDVFVGLEALPLAGASLSRIVEERYYLRATHAEQSFRVAFPSEDVRAALAVGARVPLLLVKRALFFPRAPRAVFGELYCRTEQLVFSQTIGAETRHD